MKLENLICFLMSWMAPKSSFIPEIIGIIILTFLVAITSAQYFKIRRMNIEISNFKVEALRNANYLKGDFINNYLGGVIASSIRKVNNEEVSALWEQFLRFLHLHKEYATSGNVTLEDEATYLNAFIGMQDVRFQKKSPRVVVNLDEDSMFLLEIPSMIIQPFVENAYRYAHGAEGLEISFFKPEENVYCIRISDAGAGLSKQELDYYNNYDFNVLHDYKNLTGIIAVLRKINQFNQTNQFPKLSWNFSNNVAGGLTVEIRLS